MHVYRNGILIRRSIVSTGSTGHATPGGAFSILEKKPMLTWLQFIRLAPLL